MLHSLTAEAAIKQPSYFYLVEYHTPKKEEPIHSRAWTLQEHLLSNRILIFGSRQLRWICRTTNDCDGGQKASYHQSMEHLSSRLYSLTTLNFLAAQPDPENVTSTCVTWSDA